MYPIIKRTVSSTKNGAYKKRYRSVDFEMLPWVQWLDVEPLTEEQRRIFRYLYPILLQEINTKKPSKLLHFLIGRGVLFWQDVVIIQHQRQTDMERNSPFLRILMSRGQEAYYSLIDGLRSRYGAWQGYLADLLAAKCDLTTVRDMMDIFKIVCHDLVKINPLGWTGLLRKLGLKNEQIEQTRRQNKLLSNQVLHGLLLWMGKRADKDQLLNELLIGLRKIQRTDIADGIAILVITAHAMKKPREQEEEEMLVDNSDERVDSGISSGMGFTQASDGEEVFDEKSSVTSAPRSSATPGKRFDSGLGSDSGLLSPSPLVGGNRTPTPQAPNSARLLSKRSTRHWKGSRTARPSRPHTSFSRQPTFLSIQSGKVFEYGLSPRMKTNAWEKRKPSILQFDYMTQSYFDNMFMDTLVYH